MARNYKNLVAIKWRRLATCDLHPRLNLQTNDKQLTQANWRLLTEACAHAAQAAHSTGSNSDGWLNAAADADLSLQAHTNAHAAAHAAACVRNTRHCCAIRRLVEWWGGWLRRVEGRRHNSWINSLV